MLRRIVAFLQSFSETAQADEEEIRGYEVIKWRTLNSVSQDNFKTLIQQDSFAQDFDSDYIECVGDRWRELQRLQVRLAFTLFSLILFMGAIDSGAVQEVTFFGIKISKDNAALEVLILFSSFLMIFSSAISLMTEHYGSVVTSFVEAKKDSQIKDYYILRFGWNLNSFWNGLTSHSNNLTGTTIIFVMALILIATVFLTACIFTILELFIFVSTTISIYENPKLPEYINIPIVVIAACAFLCNVICLLLRLPLPHSDFSNINKLKHLEQVDPVKAEKIRRNIAKISLKKERRNVLILQMSVMLLSIVIPYLLLSGKEFFANYLMLFSLASMSLIFIFFISPVLDKYEGRVILAEDKIKDENLRVAQYLRDKKRILRTRLFVSFVFGLLAFLYYEWSKTGQAIKAMYLTIF